MCGNFLINEYSCQYPPKLYRYSHVSFALLKFSNIIIKHQQTQNSSILFQISKKNQTRSWNFLCLIRIANKSLLNAALQMRLRDIGRKCRRTYEVGDFDSFRNRSIKLSAATPDSTQNYLSAELSIFNR